MITLQTISEVENQLASQIAEGKTIGFVPTMGALHEGHLFLVEQAKKDCDLVVVSIFVNPTQFNNPEDLRLYPRQEEQDLALLQEKGADYVFLPTKEVVYPASYTCPKVDLGFLGETMEGAFRPGHFDGVISVVSRLFDIIHPTKAYFGRKDFQQVAVIKEMARQLKLSTEIIEVAIKRSSSGLALSSRNLRLNDLQKEEAIIIYKTLNKGKEWAKRYSPKQTLEKMLNYFSDGVLELEYLTIVHPETLRSLNQYWVEGATACIVAYSGEVRLLDNMELV